MSQLPQKRAPISDPVLLPSGRKVYSVAGKSFETLPQYTLHKLVGFGAYGLVCAATDSTTARKVAIKKCRDVYRDVNESKRILREVQLLRFMDHENILSLRNFYLCGDRPETTVAAYLVTDLLDIDLSTVIRSRQTVSPDHLKYFVYQILRGLKFVHSANVMHRDLKPANLLVNINCDLKIADFGLARTFRRKEPISDPLEVSMPDASNLLSSEAFTDYVVTRWYRPPELLLMNKQYSELVDIWSVGCIFAELVRRRPIFPGKDYITQLNLICDAIGVPNTSAIEQEIQGAESKKYLRNLGERAARPTQELLPGCEPEAESFWLQMMSFLPSGRASATELLGHPYLAQLHDPSDEPVAPRQFEWRHDGDLSVDAMRELFWEEQALSQSQL